MRTRDTAGLSRFHNPLGTLASPPGRIDEIVDAVGARTAFAYDADGNLASTSDAPYNAPQSDAGALLPCFEDAAATSVAQSEAAVSNGAPPTLAPQEPWHWYDYLNCQKNGVNSAIGSALNWVGSFFSSGSKEYAGAMATTAAEGIATGVAKHDMPPGVGSAPDILQAGAGATVIGEERWRQLEYQNAAWSENDETRADIDKKRHEFEEAQKKAKALLDE